MALFACYAPEARTDERVAVAVSKTRDQCTIEIAAADPTSLRATLTTLTKLLGVYEKIGMIA
ncbi:hypothetical protein HY639_02900 [Candidatus Woesearchaeota archaeon]|nr:hypothetical protein [Candidatus Woesearchaeota archaeon]